MAQIARVLGVSLLTSALVAGIALVMISSVVQHAIPSNESIIPVLILVPVLFLAGVGGVIGAVAGAAREIVFAQRQKVSNWTESK